MKIRPQTLYASSLIIVTIFLGTAFKMVEAKKAEAQSVIPIPFGGQIASEQLCCNGIQYTLTGQYISPAQGTFIFDWAHMVPIPDIGWGLYSWWMPVTNEITKGTVTPGGVCVTIYSECESEESVNYAVNQMGTTLTTSVI